MTTGRLIFMRHGETQYNAEERMTGRADIPLTSKGEEQGRAVGAVVKHFEIDVLYASPLQRAFNTMVLALENAGGAHNHLKNADGTWNIKQRDSLKEKDVGIYTGSHKSELAKTNHVQTYDNKLPEGESNREVVERVLDLYENEILPLIKEGKTVFLSCHAVVMRALLVVIGDIAAETMHEHKVPNATPIMAEYKHGQKLSSRVLDPVSFKNKAVVVKRPANKK